MQFTKYFHMLTSNSTSINSNTNNHQHLLTVSYEPDTVLYILYGVFSYILWQWQIHNLCKWKNLVGQSVWKGKMRVGYEDTLA